MRIQLLLFITVILLNPFVGKAQELRSDESLKSRIDNFITESVENGYSGSVLVAKEGHVILSKGYGWADRAKKIPNSSQTVFNIGSITKQFTATAILKLLDEKRLNLSDTLSKYFPNAPLDKQSITIHQLLTHTSGIASQTGGFRYTEATKDEFLNEFFSSKLLYKPGNTHTYANANYILLAAIIEKVTQQEYETFLRENLWKPLEMNRTGYKSIHFNSEQLAHGYYFNYTQGEWKDWGVTQEYLPYTDKHWYSIGKGDVYATIEDLYKWHLALEQNKVLKKATKNLMEMPHVPENDAEKSFYGYGWAIFNSSKNTKIVTHNGSNGIYFADFIRDVENDLVVIVLSNIVLNQQSKNIAWEIASMIYDEKYEPIKIPKNTYELVFDFIRNNTPAYAQQLPAYIKQRTGMSITEKSILNRIGFQQVSKNKDKEWGIALLKLNVRLFPNDGNLWDSLGEGYFLLNDKNNAKKSFEKAIELRPESACHWCENSKKRLKQILEE